MIAMKIPSCKTAALNAGLSKDEVNKLFDVIIDKTSLSLPIDYDEKDFSKLNEKLVDLQGEY